ncbi:hypothetical protein [Cytobacillus firmus]|nr:hypothetical protein [Cytobacillus firmus]MCU1808171.1 hypothetical protein [Cytobacillus firmus]
MEKRPNQQSNNKPSSLPPDRINHSADKPSYTIKPSRPVTPKK